MHQWNLNYEDIAYEGIEKATTFCSMNIMSRFIMTMTTSILSGNRQAASIEAVVVGDIKFLILLMKMVSLDVLK